MEEKIEESPSWIRYVHKRIKRNKNFLCMFSGPTGSGKSWGAMSFCEQLDPNFDTDRIVFSAKQLMELINSGTLKKGSCILFDEAGIDLGSRTWQSMTNRMLNYLIQTFRHKNFILIFTSPYSDFIDTQTKRLFHAEFKTVRINERRRTVAVKPLTLQYNSSMKKWYYHYLKVIKPGTGIIKIERWEIIAPTKELIEKYEKKKSNFTAELNKGIQRKIEIAQDDRRPLTKLQEGITECWKQGITNQTKIAEKLGKKQPQISLNRQFMHKKGYYEQEYLRKKGI